jgi:acyl carrier protein
MNAENSSTLLGRVQILLAEALQVEVGEITPDLAFGDLPAWDSMGHMEVMMRLEEQFGIEVSADTIASLTSVAAICSYLEEDSHAG